MALLTIYDMAKGIDSGHDDRPNRLLRKSGWTQRPVRAARELR